MYKRQHDALALFTTSQGRYEEAEPLYERCQAIREKVLGPEHPELAATLNNRAVLYYAQVRGDGVPWRVVCRYVDGPVWCWMLFAGAVGQRLQRPWVRRNEVVVRQGCDDRVKYRRL